MMLAGSRNLLWGIPLVLLLASPLWKPALENFLSPHGHLRIKKGEAVEDKSFDLTDIRLSRYDNGQLDLVLNAAKVQSGQTGIDGLQLVDVDALLMEQGREKARISGGEGFYDGEKEILTLVDDVKVVVKNKYELQADALRYLIDYKMVKTATDIFFKSSDFSVHGRGMSYNLESGAYRVGGRLACKVK